MFFENEVFSFSILDVIEIKQENINITNAGRNFNAISFRIHSDTYLKTDTEKHYLTDNFMSYVPARLDYSRTSKVDELIVVHFDTSSYHTRKIESFLPSNPTVFFTLFRKILDCWNKKEIGYRHKCSAILCEIFAECYIQNFRPKKTNSKIEPSLEYLHENYKKCDLTIGEIASRSFMSEVYFRKIFKSEYGTSPQKYIINLRIQNAAGMISAGYYSLKDIAYMSGYSDYKYFTTEFKKVMGISPSEYLYNYK